MQRQNLVCPNCGGRLAPIVYGEPTLSTFNAAERKEVFIGGCLTNDNDPKWHCFHCNRDYYNNLKDFECADLSMDDEFKIIDKIATELIGMIDNLPDGTRVSLCELVGQKYGKIQRYKSKQHVTGYYFDMDGFNVESSILDEVLNAIIAKANETMDFELDFSEFAGQYVGLVYNIPFVIRKMDSDLMFSYRISNSLNPDYNEIRLYDKLDNNIELINSGKIVKVLTMDKILLDEVRQILAGATDLYGINPDDIPPNNILDGSENSFFFRSGTHKIRVNGCNLWVWHKPEEHRLKPTKATETLMQTRKEIAKRIYRCGVDKKYLTLG